jgi:hypothetical protein
MPHNIMALVARVKLECGNLPREMIRRSVISMKKRAGICVKVSGKAIEGKKIV